ncbi:MAG: TAXI family TRAP transporter solute-binding subunit [Magnetococcales bacterium]|nr:TAXI family TRAP transporter solute-binding subunit [Magnetococcales bacterium]
MNIMTKFMLGALVALLVSTAWADSSSPAQPRAMREQKPGHPTVTIASGDVGGVYFPTAGAICQAVKKSYAEQGVAHLHCGVEPTVGSVYNLETLADQEVELGIAQSDVVSAAWGGDRPFQTPLKQLRSVLSLYTETLTMVTRSNSGIKRMEDLKGKRINLGSPGSGTERTGRELMAACGFKPDDANLKTLSQEAAIQALRKQEIDAFLYVVGHPNESVWSLATTEKISFVQLVGGCLDSILSNRHYVKTVIPGGMYPGVEQDIPSLGVRATLMSTADVPEELIYTLTKSIVEKLYRFKRMDPDIEVPNPKALFEGLVAPLHLGAFRYFQELRVLEFKNTGVDIMSGLPPLIDRNGVQMALRFTPDAPHALRSVKPLIGAPNDREGGLPLSVAVSPAISHDGAIYWLIHDTM